MPVYLRNAFTITPPSISELGHDDMDDFIQDPDQLRDKLPQPYRMIDRVVRSVFEKAWDIISSRESERIAEASRIRPPQYQTTLQVEALQEHGPANCLCESADGQFVAAGLPRGLLVLNALTQATVDVWLQDDMSLQRLQFTTLKEDLYLICTVDESGVARLFSLAGGKLYLLQAVNESQDPKEEPEAATIQATKLESSFDGSFFGIHYQNASSRDSYLEVHRCPRDVWIKELEAQVAKEAAKEQAASSSPQPQNEAEAPTTPAAGDGEKDGEGEPASGTQGGESRNIKFSAASLMFRLRPPAPVQAATLGNPPQLGKDNGEVIGHGLNHLLTAQHLEGRDNSFTHLHHHHLNYLPKDQDTPPVESDFHFLTGGRMMTQGLDNPNHAGVPNTVAVWWTKSHNLLHYSLLKTTKADQEPKPDCVVPLSHAIIASTVSPCTSLVALALANGSVLVWDKNLGMVRRVVHLTNDAEIHKIVFLSPSVCPQEPGNYPPYGMHANVYLLATCRDSQMFLVECQLGNQVPPTRVTPPIENKDERYVDIKPIPGTPHLVMASRQDGCVYLINLFGGRVIAEVTLPEEFAVSSPSKPVVAVGGLGQTLYVQAAKKNFTKQNTEEGEEQLDAQSALCVLPVRNYTALDRHRTKQRPSIPYTIHSTAQDRVDALFTERLSQQSMRKDRMQARWGQMKTDFELMLQLRKEASLRVTTRVAYTPSSIEQSLFREEMSPNPFFGI